MTSARAPVPPVDLKARIAAFAANADASAKSGTSQTLPKANAVNGPNALRDRIASFEKQGAVPKPKGRFGFAPSIQQDPNAVKRGELYGNRVPGLSRPHIPIPSSTKTDVKTSRSRSKSRLDELERYATSPSPPGSPFLLSDNGDSVGEVLSDADLDSPDNSMSQEEAQQASLDALMSQVGDGAAPELQDGVAEAPTNAPAEVDVSAAAEASDPAANQSEEDSPAVVVSPPDTPADAPTAVPPPSPPEPDPPASAEPEPVPGPEPASPEFVKVTPPPEESSFNVESVDPTMQAFIEQLDRATRSGDAGAVCVPETPLRPFATLAPQQTGSSVADMLDELLMQEDGLDIATPIKQRYSFKDGLTLTGAETASLSSIAVQAYISQQAELEAKGGSVPETPEKKIEEKEKATAVANTPPPSQFLSPNNPHSPDSPVAEPVSPASDIYSAYLAVTPSVPFGRALPAIPEAPDSPLPIKPARQGTFGIGSEGSTPPSSAPLATPSDDGFPSISPGDGTVRIGSGSPPLVTSPQLSVVIPGAEPKQQANSKLSPPVIVRDTLAPAPRSAGDSSASSPASAYSLGSAYSATSPSSGRPVSRKVSRSSKTRSTQSPPPPLTPYEELVLTPIEGPKGFRAVVHEKVVEGKSRPVSFVKHQYEDLPSPTPMNAANMSDLAALLVDAQRLEESLATPHKKPLPPRPAPPSISAPPPSIDQGPHGRRGTPDQRGTLDRPSQRPRPVQDLPESPDDGSHYGRVSRETSIASRASTISRTSRYDRTSGYEHRPLPVRPSADRTIERKASRPSLGDSPRPTLDSQRPSLDRVPSRPSLDQSTSARPSGDSQSASRPQLQPMFLSADPNAARIPLPPRPKSAMAGASGSRSQSSTSPVPSANAKGSPKTGTGYLSNLLSRAKSSGNLRPTPDPRDSVGSSSDDSVMVSTPPTPPDEMSASEVGAVRSSRMFKNSLSRASTFADRLLHRKDGQHQGADVAIASEVDEDENGVRALPRPPRPLPLPPQPIPPRGLPPPVPGEGQNASNLPPVPPPGQRGLLRRGSPASVSTTDISAALDNIAYDSPERTAAPIPRSGPPGPNAYISPRPAPHPPMPPPSQPLPPPPPNQPLPAPPRGASRGRPPAGYGLPSNPGPRKSLPSRPKTGQPGQLRSGML